MLNALPDSGEKRGDARRAGWGMESASNFNGFLNRRRDHGLRILVPWPLAYSMDLNRLPIFSLISEKMNFLTKRQETISGNLANADTPGYRTKRLEEPDFSRYLSEGRDKLKVVTTDEEHINTRGGRRLGGVTAREAAIHGREQVSPDGNSVDISEQVMLMADTQMQYNLATNVYRKQVQLLKTAIGRPGS